MSDSKDYVSCKDEHGSINIAEEVVASIAALAANEVSGVAGLAAAGMDISELLGRKNITRGVKLTLEEDSVVADVQILIKFGFTVLAVAKSVQEAVTNAVTSMTGLTIKAVNVHVSGIAFEKDAKDVKEAKSK